MTRPARGKRIAFFHPDLGIGGAERLIIDAAFALQDAGHRVTIFTSRHDPARSFPETRDGSVDVQVYGALVPSQILQRLRAPLAIARMAYAALRAALSHGPFDLVVCDLVPQAIPFLRLVSRAPLLYYCHFPDKLQTPPRRGLYRLYRQPLDWAEERASGMADRILVNSHFTASVFRESFASLRASAVEVLYPGIGLAGYAEPKPNGVAVTAADLPLQLVSINRFEFKKRHDLAILALAALRRRVPPAVFARLRLTIAGGFDHRLAENREAFAALEALAQREGLLSQIAFRRSVSDEERRALLSQAHCVLYTPSDEHFGYGPVEAMAAGAPVVAVNSGGPLETVRHRETGYLCAPTPEAFAEAIAEILGDPAAARRMGDAGRSHVSRHFSRPVFAQRLQGLVAELLSAEPR